MPKFLTPDAVRFELLDDKPILRLPAPAPAAIEADRWFLMSGTTLCVVDGPDDAGYLVARFGADGADAAPAGWDDAVARAGGSLVAFGDEPVAAAAFVALS
jgi:hypothetical protein